MAYWRHFYHLVWATYKREPMINERIEEPLHDYLKAKAEAIGCQVHAINGMAEHIHMIVSIPPAQSVASVVKQLKGSSSHHVNKVLCLSGGFAWEAGYGTLTLGERQLHSAVAYVQGQKQHHAVQTTNRWLEECGVTTTEVSES